MKKHILVLICAALLVTVSGCKKNPEVQPAGALVETVGCKVFQAAASGTVNEPVTGAKNDCLDYHYDGRGTLTLTHIDAGFNCCPGEITAEIECNGGVIEIIERETAPGCLCLCLYDLHYQITNLSPGQYTLRVIEPYVEANDRVLEVVLGLFSSTSGTYCLERSYYPWI